MKGFQSGSFKIALDYSGNETKAYIRNTTTGEFSEQAVSDIEFEYAIDKADAAEKKLIYDAEVEAVIQARIDQAVYDALHPQE
jgi:hypothetical protein